MPDIFFDFGNADVKYYDGASLFGYYPHNIIQISEAEWRKVVGRSKQPPQGYISVEGLHYVYGDKARRYTLKEKPRGANRYTPEYYGVAMMAAISELYDPSIRVINAYCSHAPRDIEYAQDIENAVRGRWNFVSGGGSYTLTIKTVETFDEPLGGYNHAVLTKVGQVLKSNPYTSKTVLVIDVGGYTCDVVAVDPNGQIDDSSIKSVLTGALNSFEFFESELRSLYRNEFKGVGKIDERRLESAMLKGFYQAGNTELPCKDIGQSAINMLVNDIQDVIQQYGGAINYDLALLTGGGSALVYESLDHAVPMLDFHMAEDERENMRYANVFGGAKLFAMLKRLGYLS